MSSVPTPRPRKCRQERDVDEPDLLRPALRRRSAPPAAPSTSTIDLSASGYCSSQYAVCASNCSSGTRPSARRVHGTSASSSARVERVDREQRRSRSSGRTGRSAIAFDHVRRQVRGGKTPWRAMQKLSVRYGCMLLCGWSPPAGASAMRRSGSRPLVLALIELRRRPSGEQLVRPLVASSPGCRDAIEGVGVGRDLRLEERHGLRSAGLAEVVERRARGPGRDASGAFPCMFGSAKLLLPSPPYVVPRSEKSAVFCEIGRSWPSQNAQPFGAKLNGKMRISATKGSHVWSPQVWLGKIPKSEMMKSTQRYGWKLLCGCEPPDRRRWSEGSSADDRRCRST